MNMNNFDEKKVWYLILHIGGPDLSPKQIKTFTVYRKTKAGRMKTHTITPQNVKRTAKRSARAVGIYLSLLPVMRGRSQFDVSWRFFFRFQRFKRDDQLAQKFAESLIYSAEFLHGPLINQDQPIFAFRVPASVMQSSSPLTFEQLEEVERVRPYEERRLPFTYSLGSACFLLEYKIEAAWRIAPIVFQNENLRRALAFYSESQHKFYVSPGELPEVINNGDDAPETTKVQMERESAIQNAFKAIEAIIGDPPKDKKKLHAKLTAIGIDPNEQVGYRTKRSIETEIREMNRVRDKKAAHGSTDNRSLTAIEVLNYQDCAGYIVQAAIETFLRGLIYGD